MRDAVDGLVGVDDAVGVGVFRHAPHTLDRRVLHKLLDHVHVRTGRGHGDGDKLKAERLRDLKVAVIAGGRAEPFDGVELAPRRSRVQKPVRICLGDGVVHERERRVAADETLLRLAAEDVRPQRLCRRQTRELAVVAGVDAVHLTVLRGLEHRQNVRYEIELLLAGLAARHVQLERLRLEIVKMRCDGGLFGGELRLCPITICHSPHSSLSIFRTVYLKMQRGAIG